MGLPPNHRLQLTGAAAWAPQRTRRRSRL